MINTLLDIPGNNYRIGNNEWSDGSRSDVVYEPVQSSLPIVIIEIQHHVNADFMTRAVQYCVQAYKKTSRLPIIIVFNTELTNIELHHVPVSPTLSGYLLLSSYWAAKAILINPKTIRNTSNTNAFTTVATFVIQKHSSLLECDKWQDQTMKRLFAILQTNLQQSINREQKLVNTIKVMCDPGMESLGKILDTAERLQYDSPAIHNEAQNHMKKLQTLKRQCYELDKPEKKKDDDMCNDEKRFKNTIAFVDDYKLKLDKKNKKGKTTMSWVGCHAKLKNEPNVIQYKTSEVLRVQYTKHKRVKAVK
ncbi:hypothetical protein BDC45DRAFT_554045 [Circinella umbellata]|nr:hypothetical protein BDC45DRAFT_498377 [Circinella umbellata]KAI7858447.1 hypothetical protein BDC45DRAFT_554045 [Circinella umbellata]